MLRRELCFAALHEPGAMAIDVDLLQQEYLRRARSHGATVRTNARVTGIRHDGQWHLTIDGTTVRCSHVVNAAGAWADEVAIMGRAQADRASPRCDAPRFCFRLR